MQGVVCPAEFNFSMLNGCGDDGGKLKDIFEAELNVGADGVIQAVARLML